MMTMKKTDKIKAEKIKSYIDNSKKILLHCHPFADPDSVGSVLAMREYLMSEGKEVIAIIGDSGYPATLNKLCLEEKILPINYFESEIDSFDLFLILDSSSKTQISRIGEFEFPKGMKTVVIDHHKTNKGFGNIDLILDNCASTTHILYKLFHLWNVDITKDIALYLFIGLFADTGGFKYLNSTPEVLSVASTLASINPDFHSVVFDIENSKSPLEVEMMGLALSSINKHFNDRVAFSLIPYDLVKKKNLSKKEALEGLIPNILRSVLGWEIVASLVEVSEGETVVSLRTRDEKIYDVSKIALTVGVNGGGHPGAAGVTIMNDIKGAEKELLKAIRDLYGKNLD